MVIAVLHKRSQTRSLRSLAPSMLGDGLPERLRSTLLALVGVVAAAALGSVAFVLQQGFPLVASGPIPAPPAKREQAPKRIVSKQEQSSAAAPRSRLKASDDAAAPTPSGEEAGKAPVESPPPAASPVLVTGSDRVGDGGGRDRPSSDSPPQTKPTVAKPPAPDPVEEPPATISTEPPEPAPEPVPEEAPASHPGNGNAYGKGNGKGVGSGGSPPGQTVSGQAPGHARE